MTDSGRPAVARSSKLDLWNATAKVDVLVVPHDLCNALEAVPMAGRWFNQAEHSG
jgi:uncharacterized protein YdeI (YjbR/CyaY-like superfamily)